MLLYQWFGIMWAIMGVALNIEANAAVVLFFAIFGLAFAILAAIEVLEKCVFKNRENNGKRKSG